MKPTNTYIIGGEVPIYGINKHVWHKRDEKYSPNLYRFLTRRNKLLTNIFQDPETKIYYIGLLEESGWCIGAKLMRVFCMGGQAETWAYMPKHTNGWHDVTKWFWKKYLEVGKKIYDLPEWKIMHEDESKSHKP